MSLQQAIRIVSEYHTLSMLVPKWAWNLPVSRYFSIQSSHTPWTLNPRSHRLQSLATANATVETFMRSQITKRKADLEKHLLGGSFEDTCGFKDVFSMLVQANETEGKLKLDDQDLVSGRGGIFAKR
jgi:hypothetical protein